MNEINITRAMIAAGVEALARAADTAPDTVAAADTMVEIVFRAMVRVAYEEAPGPRPPS
jgi:hypothetical protein